MLLPGGTKGKASFLNDKDFKTYLSLLSEYKSRYRFHLYVYVLMGNHVHLLVEVETTPLSKIMQELQFRYTRYFNRRYGKEGYLFQGRSWGNLGKKYLIGLSALRPLIV